MEGGQASLFPKDNQKETFPYTDHLSSLPHIDHYVFSMI